MSKKNNFVIDVTPIEQEMLKAEQFLKLVQENPGIIKSSQVIPPAPGKPGFGKFLVKYIRPIYKHA